jgi:hypothetical protein
MDLRRALTRDWLWLNATAQRNAARAVHADLVRAAHWASARSAFAATQRRPAPLPPEQRSAPPA